MTKELIGQDVVITDITGKMPEEIGRHTIMDVDNRKLVFIDGYTYLQNEEEFQKLKQGKTAVIHSQEVIIDLVSY